MSDIVTRLRAVPNADAQAAADTIEKLRALLDAGVSIMMNASVTTGVCCCGSPVGSHGLGDGHSPVDSGAYAADRWMEQVCDLL